MPGKGEEGKGCDRLEMKRYDAVDTQREKEKTTKIGLR